MSGLERIVIRREDTTSPSVSAAVERSRALRKYEAAQSAPLPAFRRILFNPLVYLPVAGVVGAVLVGSLLEPSLNDGPIVGGEVILINEEPFDHEGTAFTIGSTEVIARRDETALVPGADGQLAYGTIDEIRPGDHVEAAGVSLEPRRIVAIALRPSSKPRALSVGDDQAQQGEFDLAMFMFFPTTAMGIALCLSLAEGITTRNWVRMIKRTFLSSWMAFLAAFLAYIPAGIFMIGAEKALEADLGDKLFITVESIPPGTFLIHVICRSCAWTCIGAAIGIGLSLFGATAVQRRNAVFGGALGGTIGGLFFDPIDRLFTLDPFVGAGLSRLVGLLAVGLCVGLFLALVEQLSREAWFRVRTGPLAGKSFILYRSPTSLGSSPECDIYLFKDPDVDPRHAVVHRVGNTFEIEDTSERRSVRVNGEEVKRSPLSSGDRVMIGETVLEFEVRARRVVAEAVALEQR